jgi:hypothetical protein
VGIATVSACLSVPAVEETDGSTSNTAGSSSTDPSATSSNTVSTGTGSTTSSGSTSGGSTGGPVQLEFTDDEFEGEFGEGTYESTIYATDAVELDAGQGTGTFTSRVFDAGGEVRWTTLSWRPAAPYDKPLLYEGADDTGYPDNNLLASSEQILLYPFDGGPFAPNDLVQDRSGRGNDGTVIGNLAVFSSEGKFGDAAEFTDENYVSIPIDAESDFQFLTSDFTWSMWINTVNSCAGDMVSANQVYMGAEDTGADASHMWFGCSRPQSSICPEGDLTGGRAGGTFNTDQSAGEQTGLCGSTNIVDGQWHHLVVVKRDHSPATFQLYVDGQVEVERTPTLVGPYTFVDGHDFTFGAFSQGTFQAQTTLDEVAIWKRSLAPEEVLDLYRRGAFSLSVAVRACMEPDCSDDPPFGDGVTETPDVADAGTPVDLENAVTGRYVQYRVAFEGVPALPGGHTPRLLAVTVRGEG